MKKFLVGLGVSTSVVFSNIADSNFSYQDYMDFGQNKGMFTPGARDFYLVEKGTGTVYKFDVPMPDFVGTTDNNGVMTLVYGSYVFTAFHTVLGNAYTDNFAYTKVDTIRSDDAVVDTAYVRYNKFFTGLVSPDGFLAVDKDEGFDTTRYTEAFRSGQGAAYSRLDITEEKPNGTVVKIQSAGIRTGGRLTFARILENGRIMFNREGVVFSNNVTRGDSGSPMFVWDSQENKWLVVGSANSTNLNTFTNYAPHLPDKLNEIIQRNTNPTIALNNQSQKWSAQELIGTFEAKNNKDIILQGGGEIVLETNIDQGHGGIYFDKNRHYVFRGSNDEGVFYWKGGGLSIDEGSEVDWYVKGVGGKKYTNRPGYEVMPDSLHKIGKGTLNVFVQNQGFLNLGEGKVVLNTEDLAFDGISIVSGRATLELVEGKASAIDPDRVFFSSRGGTLDIKGNDLTFNLIQASDNGAKIINTGSKIAKITITKNMLNIFDMPIEGSGSFLFHGNIGNNILIYKDAQSQIACPSSNAVSCVGYGENLLAFDGNITNPDGKIEHYNGKLVLQGHPVIHAYLPAGTAEHVKGITGDEVYTTPTKIDQEDWENRIYVLDEITISQKDENTSSVDNSSTFILGRNATLLSNIQASRTKVYFGGEQKIYIDNRDGEDTATTTTDIAKFSQTLDSGVSQKNDSFYFEGSLSGSNKTTFMVVNTESNPLNFGTFQAKDKSIFRNNQAISLDLIPTHLATYVISLDDTSSFKAKYVNFYGNNQVILTGGKENNISFLRLYNQQSIIQGDLAIKDISLNEETGISGFTTLDYDSAIIFSSLASSLRLTGSLDLGNKSILLFDNQQDSFMNTKYNTPYNLITANTINDARTSKDIVFLNTDYLKFMNPKTIITSGEVNLIFEKKQNDLVVDDTSRNFDWLDRYILNVQGEDSQDIAIQNLDRTNEVVGNYRGLLERIARTNDQKQSIFKDIFTDTLIFTSGADGDTRILSFLEEVDSNLSKISSSDVNISLGVLNTVVNFSSIRNQKLLNQKIAKNDFGGFKKVYLAQNDQKNSSTSYKTDQAETLDYLVLQQNTFDDYKNNFYASIVGSYYNYEGNLGAMGISVGYDRILLQEEDHFAGIGASFNYLYGIYNQKNIKQTNQAFILGLHSQYFYKNNEFLFQIFGGASLDEKTTNIHSVFNLSELNATTLTTNILASASIVYKYRFLLQKNSSLYQDIKPLIGLGYQYFYIPKSSINDLFHFEKINQGIPIAEAGLEYNISTRKVENTIQASLKYNIQPIKQREVGIGTSAPLDYRVSMQDLYIKLTYLGNIFFNSSIFLTCQVSTEISPINPNYFGVLGNVSFNYRF